MSNDFPVSLGGEESTIGNAGDTFLPPIVTVSGSLATVQYSETLMPSASQDLEFNDEQEEILHALHFAVGNICRSGGDGGDGVVEEEDSVKDNNRKLPMSKSSIRTLTQMTYHYATKCLAKDLAAFSKHANRKTITVDDVKLVARKNPRGLMDAIEGFCEHSSESNIRERKRNDFMGSNKANVKNKRRFKENRPMMFDTGTDEDATRSILSSDDDDDGESSTDNLLLQGEKKIWRKHKSSFSEESSQQLQMEWNLGNIASSSSSSSSSSDESTEKKDKRQNGNNAKKEREHAFQDAGDKSTVSSFSIQDPKHRHYQSKSHRLLSSENAIDLVDSESE